MVQYFFIFNTLRAANQKTNTYGLAFSFLWKTMTSGNFYVFRNLEGAWEVRGAGVCIMFCSLVVYIAEETAKANLVSPKWGF